MLRECVAAWLAIPATGCSLLLDFSDQAIPRDAAPDAPYSAEECAYKEPNDTLSGAAPIAASETGPAAICAGGLEDFDFYRFTVPAGTTRVEIRLDSVFREGGDLDLRLLDANATRLAASHTFTDQERITCPGTAPPCAALVAGEYVFEVLPSETGSVNRYTFAVTFTP